MRYWKRRNKVKTKEEEEQMWQGDQKKRDFLTPAPMFPFVAELLLALPGVKRTVDGRARRVTLVDRSCACLFMQGNS